MSLIRNFISFKLVTITDANVWMLMAVWVVMVVAGLWSVISRPTHVVNKIFWCAAIICLPIVGLLVYTCACLFTAEWELLHQMGFFSKSKKKIIDSINASES